MARTFEVEADPAELPGLALFIPEAEFPLPYEQVCYRVIVYLDGKPAAQTPIAPLSASASGP